MKAQLSLEIMLSLFISISIIAFAYPIYLHSYSISKSAQSSIYQISAEAGRFSWGLSNTCRCK